MSDIVRRRVAAIHAAAPRDVEAILIHNGTHPDPTFFYCTHFLKTGVFEGSTAIIFPDGAADIIVPELEEPAARQQAVDGQNIVVYRTSDEYKAALRECLDGISCIGINASAITHATVLRLKKQLKVRIIDCSDACAAARLIKDAEELKRIRKACAITTAAVDDALATVREGMKEYELAADISAAMRRAGASGDAFTPIVAFGTNSAVPHHGTGATRLRSGHFILMDVGASYQHYCADFTHTVVFGTASKAQRELYETVREAQRIAREAMRPGGDAEAVHDAAEEYIDSAHGGRYTGRFIHSAGHSIGLETHDGASLKQKALTLAERMVFTVEPGVYLPRFGGVRIEDTVVIKKGKNEILTRCDRALRIV